MKSALWNLIKIVVCTSALWALVAALLAFVASLGWNASLAGHGLPPVSFGTAFAAIAALFAVVYAVRFAWSSPLLSVEKEYRELTWSAVFWPPAGTR